MSKALYSFQQSCVNFIITNKRVGLFLNMGMGKTVIALTAAKKLLEENKIKKVLVVAPKSVANNNWHTEIASWEHLKYLTYSKIIGNERDRLRALKCESDIYIIGRDNIAWLKQTGFDKFGFIILDESSSFKNHKSKRFQSLVNFKYLYAVLLTGTPIPNGYTDLWSQIFLLDHGKRLGDSFKQYLNNYFIFDRFGEPVEVKDETLIKAKISDITKSISNEEAKIHYPKVIYNNHYIELDEQTLEDYELLQSTLELEEGISAKNQEVIVGKLLQFCNGNIYYDRSKNYKEIHKYKLEALIELLESCDSNVLIVYQFKSDLEQLQKALSEAVIFDSGNDKHVTDWNQGKIKVLLCHPASASMGLNLQFGGNIIIWYSLTWNLEHYLQFNARLDRPGQKKIVVINHLVCKDTIEEIIVKSLSNKELIQDNLVKFLTCVSVQ